MMLKNEKKNPQDFPFETPLWLIKFQYTAKNKKVYWYRDFPLQKNKITDMINLKNGVQGVLRDVYTYSISIYVPGVLSDF